MSSKGQAWLMDFMVSLLIFTVALLVYFNYTGDFSGGKNTNINELVAVANSVSSAMLQPGYPSDWNNGTVIRLGLTSNDVLNATKVRRAKGLNYSTMKTLLGSRYDFSAVFVDQKGRFINIQNVCDVGGDLVSITYPLRSAYYYTSETLLKNLMEQTFQADVYQNAQHVDLITNLSKYSLVILEHPNFQPADLNEFYEELNNFTGRGGYLMVSGQLITSGSGRDLNGMVFDKRTGTSSAEQTARVNITDELLSLNVADAIVFNQYFYTTNSTPPAITAENPYPAVNYTVIATYNQSNWQDPAITKWKYGNGSVYFFSDFDASYFSGSFIGVIEDFTKLFFPGICDPESIENLNTTSINPQNLVRVERLTSYNGKVVKMMISLWE